MDASSLTGYGKAHYQSRLMSHSERNNSQDSVLPSLKVKKPHSARKQIVSHVRDLIVSGTLAPGAKLPSTHALAQEWAMKPTTVQNALSCLVHEGLLDRVPRVGTYVRTRKANLEKVAIYLPEHIWGDPNRSFLQAVCTSLTVDLKQRGVMGRFWVHPAQGLGREDPWPDLVEAAKRFEFQALIGLVFHAKPIEWLRKLPVPTAFLTEAPVANRVMSDYKQFCEDGLAALQRQGCRSVGLITSMPLFSGGRPEGEMMPFHRYFRNTAEARGLKWRKDWVKVCELKNASRGDEQGYKAFCDLWQTSRHPDGLLVFPDGVGRGVLMGVVSQHVDVPRDLKLVLHRNAEVGLVCPVPATFMDFHVADAAKALFAMVERQFKGEVVQPVVLPYHVTQFT